jgi:hypothetical protein
MTLIVMAYAYHSIKGFILISWVLLSFIIPSIPFVNFTINIILPLFTTEFLFLYFINIPGLFDLASWVNNPIYKYLGYEF